MGRYGILCVGLVCVDIINEVNKYPVEDSDERCVSQRWQRGGNASNSCTILSIFGVKPHFMGTIAAESYEQRFIEEDFAKYSINTQSAVHVYGSSTPVSCVLASMTTGTRTIIHSNKDLRELSLEDFLAINISRFSWIHFEGRNVSTVCKMMKHLQVLNAQLSNKITVSVELEKPSREGLQDLIPLGDVIFVSKDYSRSRGWMSIKEALENVSNEAQESAIVICCWGEEGAGAKAGMKGVMVFSPSYPPTQVCDTLGAGDSFNAGALFALSIGQPLEKAIRFGCRVAGFKVGVRGWAEVTSLAKVDFVQEMVSEFKKKASTKNINFPGLVSTSGWFNNFGCGIKFFNFS